MSNLAKQLIEKEKRERTGKLDLGNCGLMDLEGQVPELFECRWLEILILSEVWQNLDTGEYEYSENYESDDNSNFLSSPIPPLPFPNLKKLIICGRNGNHYDISGMSFLSQLNQLRTIDISHTGIKNLDILGDFVHLASLNLEGNEIKHYNFIENLHNLESLSLESTGLKSIEFLGESRKLKNLYLSQNSIENINAIDKLKQLKHLDISWNDINDYSVLANLISLNSLELAGSYVRNYNFLREIPNLQKLDLSYTNSIDFNFLRSVTSIKNLHLNGNLIKDLSFLEGLTSLESLYLNNSRITDIRHLEKLVNLIELDLGANEVKDITPILSLIKQGVQVTMEEEEKGINLWNNPIEVPPIEVVELGNEAIIKWLESNEKRPILEAKVMFIGDSGYGKTHLIEMLLKGCIGGREITTTLGIERNRLADAVSSQGPVRLNVWDLGGQEFMRSTHQFFFTTRTLYILVTDARQGEKREDIRHWLNLVKELGENAPVLIVINKIDQNEHDIDRERLEREYPNIAGFVRTCVYDKPEKGIWATETINKLKETIESVATNAKLMPEVFVLQRPEWFQVKEAIECESKPYITIEEYRKIEQIATLPLDEQDFGLKQMAFIGTVVSYHKDPRLADTHVIDPKWIMDGIYAILNDGDVKDVKKGEFSFGDMRRILKKDAYPDGKLPFLTDLMRKFKLCYPLRGSSDTFLLPDLFTDAEPPNVWEEESTLRFRFNYDTYPPDAFMAQFIAAKYLSIEDEHRWRSGVVIHNDKCRAVVRRSFKYEHIEIEIAGPERQRRGYLHSIRETFYELHKPFGTLKPKEELPWKDEWLDFRDLLSAEADGDKAYRIRGGEKVNLSELLDGYAVETDRAFFEKEFRDLKKDITTIKRAARETEQNTLAILDNQALHADFLESLLIYAQEHRASLTGIFEYIDALPPASTVDLAKFDSYLESKINPLIEKIPSTDEIVKAWKEANKKLPGEVDNKVKVKTKLALIYGAIPKWSHEIELEHSIDPTTFLKSKDGRPFHKRLQEDIKDVLAGKKELKDLLIES